MHKKHSSGWKVLVQRSKVDVGLVCIWLHTHIRITYCILMLAGHNLEQRTYLTVSNWSFSAAQYKRASLLLSAHGLQCCSSIRYQDVPGAAATCYMFTTYMYGCNTA